MRFDCDDSAEETQFYLARGVLRPHRMRTVSKPDGIELLERKPLQTVRGHLQMWKMKSLYQDVQTDLPDTSSSKPFILEHVLASG